MTDIAKTPFDLTLHLVSVGGNSDGGWIPGNGYPNPQVGRVGQRYVDVLTGHIYGPKTRNGWPAEHTHTLNLGNVAGEFTNMLSRVPALEVRASNLEARTKTLEGRADATADMLIQHRTTLTEHGLRIETLEADSSEIKRRIGMVDTSLSARMLLAEDALNDLSRLRGLDLADFNSRLSVLKTELDGNSSEITHLRESYTGFTQTWAQDILTLRSEFEGNFALAQETLRTYADRFTAIATSISELRVQVGDARSAITSESLARANQYSALAQQITSLSAEVGGSLANIITQQTALVDDFQAYASSVEHLSVELGDVRADITEKVEVMATANSAVASRVSTLDVATATLSGRIQQEESARISGDTAVLTSAKTMIASSEAGVRAKVTEESGARIAGDQAEAYQRGLLDTKFTNQGTNLSAAISAETKARTDAITAETSARNKQVSALQGEIGAVSAAITAESATRASAIAAETSARNKQVSAVDTKVNQVTTTVGGIQTQVTGLSAAITKEATTRANAIAAETSARNQQVSTLNTSIGQVSSAVTQEATTRATVDGYLGGRYTLSVSTSGGGYQSVAGMEIASTSSAGRQTINHIAFFADRFYISHGTSSAAEAPFMVEGGKVYIKSAVIQDASITNAKIGNAEVSTLKIAGNAVTVPGAATGKYSASVSLSTDMWTAFVIIATFVQGTGKDSHLWTISVNDIVQASAKPRDGTTGALTAITHVPAGTHKFSVTCATNSGDASCGITVIGVKR